MNIVVLGTGGTIAGQGTDPENRPENDRAYTAATLPVAALLQGVKLPVGAEVLTEQVAQLDSKDMDHATWRHLLARCRHWLAQDVAGIVITRGTDTLEETLFFLSQTLPANKPVVLTCAMRSATSREADGPQNLSDALSLVCEPQARGVHMVCAGQVFGADVQKVHASRLDAYASARGAQAVKPTIQQADSTWQWSEKNRTNLALIDEVAIEKRASACLRHDRWPRVEVVMSHAGATGAVVDALLTHPPDGLVVAATGNLTVHQALQAALDRATKRGVRVVLASRCVWGGVLPASGHAGRQDLAQAGSNDLVWVSEGVAQSQLTPTKARIALMLSLMQS